MSREKNNFNSPPSDEFENVVNRIDNDDRRTNFSLNDDLTLLIRLNTKFAKAFCLIN